MTSTSNQIERLAPDPQVLAAGRRLGSAAHWQGLGRQGAVVWGECRGSALYTVHVDTAAAAYTCSCPSRKFPCKHVVGLLTLLEGNEAFPSVAPPDWVAARLARRVARVREREVAASAPAPARPSADSASKRREEQRARRIMDGVDALELWMCDLVRNGLATVESQPAAFWQRQAARLVDAGAPGLAAWLRRLAGIPGSSPQWPERLLGEMGRLALLLYAYRRLDTLPPALQADVRTAIGWTLTKDQVSAAGEHVVDQWLALGAVVEEDEQLRVQRTWLRGLRTGRTALVLQFAVGSSSTFPWVADINHIQEMELHFWPGAWPQRAFIAHRLGPAEYTTARRAGSTTIGALLTEAAQALAANPWLDRTCTVLHDVVPIRQSDTAWFLRDREEAALPLQPGAHWRLLAQSGGYPIDVHGEWDGTYFRSFAYRIAETAP